MDDILGEYSRQWAAQRRSEVVPPATHTHGNAPVHHASAPVHHAGAPAHHVDAPPADDGYDEDIIDDVIADVDSGSADNTMSTDEMLDGYDVPAPASRSFPMPPVSHQYQTPKTPASTRTFPRTTHGLPSFSTRANQASGQSQPLSRVDESSLLVDTSLSSSDSDSDQLTEIRVPVSSSAYKPGVISKQYLSSLLDDTATTLPFYINSTDTSLLISDVTDKYKDLDDDKKSDSGVSDSTLDDDDKISVMTPQTLINNMTDLGRYSSRPMTQQVEVTAYPVYGMKTNKEKTPATSQRLSQLRPGAKPQPVLPPDDSVLEGQQLVARYVPSPATDPIVQIIEVLQNSILSQNVRDAQLC